LTRNYFTYPLSISSIGWCSSRRFTVQSLHKGSYFPKQSGTHCECTPKIFVEMYSISNIYLCKLHAACTGNLRLWKNVLLGSKNFNTINKNFMHLTVSSWFLISFVMWGAARAGRLSFLMHLLPPSPIVWALKPPSWSLVHKTTCAPMIYVAMCLVFWMCVSYPLQVGQVGRGWALDIESFLGPVKFAFAVARDCINHRCINS